ncbi:TPA: restriction endonuclease [Candidatus Komeilibacteria bacterium]|nr:restriction endonuclease [Candidatus Komeilibacteria bacterium]
MSPDWQQKIKQYCEKYNIPVLYIAETMYEPKVVPMIRGKAFEFSVMITLQKVLQEDEWEVNKPIMNAQIGFHDVDVRIFHKPTKKVLRVECKLAKKGGYRLFPDGHSEIRVKCMRSRTLGPKKVKELAPKFGIEEKVLAIHNDQYLPSDFDIVISSIGNAFYRTDSKTGLFEWKPTKTEEEFLTKLNTSSIESLKDFAFHRMYIAKTEKLAIGHSSGVVCTRGKCKNKTKCGFIPNYPIIYFSPNVSKPTNGWVPIEESQHLFKSLLSQ